MLKGICWNKSCIIFDIELKGQVFVKKVFKLKRKQKIIMSCAVSNGVVYYGCFDGMLGVVKNNNICWV